MEYLPAEIVGSMLAAALYRVACSHEFDVMEADRSMASLEAVYGGSGRLRETTTSNKLAGEFIGTFFVVLTKGLNRAATSPAESVAYAAAMSCMVYSVADVSGGFLNPCITLAVFLSGFRGNEKT